MRSVPIKAVFAFVAATTLATAGPALAAGSHAGGHGAEPQGHGHAHAMKFGAPGKAGEVDRTIEIVMGDNFFEPESFSVRPGETIRFVVVNAGDFLHEFNIGTATMHAAHQEEMLTMMEQGTMTPTGLNHDAMTMHGRTSDMHGAAHDDPNSVLLEPGETKELVWRFAAASDLEFACNVPGHYEAGMRGDVDFARPHRAGS